MFTIIRQTMFYNKQFPLTSLRFYTNRDYMKPHDTHSKTIVHEHKLCETIINNNIGINNTSSKIVPHTRKKFKQVSKPLYEKDILDIDELAYLRREMNMKNVYKNK